MTDWADNWHAYVQRIDPYHVGAGQPTGGQFTFANNAGSGSNPATGGRKGGKSGILTGPPTRGQLAQKRQMIAQANSDRARARVLEQQLHSLEQQLRAAQTASKKASTAKTAKAAKSVKAKSVKAKSATAKKTTATAASKRAALSKQISALKSEIHGLLAQARSLDQRAASI